ncbi:hypothetical protein ACFP3I_23050 [Chryseobacterium arachidis]|uniref:hypothetical protein n=1 Tax=Chryseobacterium arachidis TaxID=1416778 RepID=UPI00360F550A
MLEAFMMTTDANNYDLNLAPIAATSFFARILKWQKRYSRKRDLAPENSFIFMGQL